MKISEEAVEAAAKAVAEHEGYGWLSKPAEIHATKARHIIEAAAPLIAAQALRDAADQLEYGNPIFEFINDRADSIEAGN